MATVDLSVIVPVLNEEGNLRTLYDRLTQSVAGLDMTYEFIFVNDGSSDRSLELIRTLAHQDPAHVRYIDFTRNFGHQVAIAAGLEHCTGHYVVIIDADLQDPPELIAPMLETLQEGYEVVYARRVKRKGETLFKRASASFYYRLLDRITPIPIPLDTGDYRIITREVVEILRQMPEQHKFTRGQISWIGFRQTAFEYERDPRFSGKSSYSLVKMLRLAIDGITGFSTMPLKIATIMGFIASGLAFVLILFVLFAKLIGPWLGMAIQPGWASQMIVTLFLGGVQLIGIGILGEYIARINDNVKQRPLYVIRQKSGELQKHNADHQ